MIDIRTGQIRTPTSLALSCTGQNKQLRFHYQIVKEQTRPRRHGKTRRTSTRDPYSSGNSNSVNAPPKNSREICKSFLKLGFPKLPIPRLFQKMLIGITRKKGVAARPDSSPCDTLWPGSCCMIGSGIRPSAVQLAPASAATVV